MIKMKELHKGNDKCPNCKIGYLYPRLISGMVGIFTQKVIFDCNICNASFKINFRK